MGKEEGNRNMAPQHGTKEETVKESRYTSPISQPGKPASLSIPDPVSYEPRSLKDEVQDMLSQSGPIKPVASDEAKPGERPVEVTPPPPSSCMKCGFKLSSLDVKMGQCFKCGAAVGPDPGRDRPARGSITVGI